MNKLKNITPEELFDAALIETKEKLTPAALKLLTSGLGLLRQDEPKLCENELMSIYSMVAYAAYTQKVCEETVRSVLLSKFGLDEIQNIPARLFQPAINFLVDLEMDKIIN